MGKLAGSEWMAKTLVMQAPVERNGETLRGMGFRSAFYDYATCALFLALGPDGLRADAAAGAPSYLSSRRVEDPVSDANVVRHQAMERETTGSPVDPLGARLPHDIVSEMEAELKQQVDRLVAERH